MAAYLKAHPADWHFPAIVLVREALVERVATKEMGKPLKESLSEIEKCAWVMEFYGDNGQTFIHDEVLNTDARKSFITFEPIGVIGSIMPWNFPFWQPLRFADLVILQIKCSI